VVTQRTANPRTPVQFRARPPISFARFNSFLLYQGLTLAYYANDGGSQMPTRNVVLTKENQLLIDGLVQSGRYQNASEVLRDGLRLVERREVEDDAKLAALRRAAEIGIEAIDNGQSKYFADVADLTTYLRDLGNKTIADQT
jgi:antitoxin ParD1/3/4